MSVPSSGHDSSYFEYALAYHLLESGDLEQALLGMLRQALLPTNDLLGHYSLGCVLNRGATAFRQAVFSIHCAKPWINHPL